jgi:hypothetical protein
MLNTADNLQQFDDNIIEECSLRHIKRRFLLLFLMLLILHASLLSSGASAATTNPVVVTFGQSVVPLNGPWKFQTGDDPRWAEPSFDDSGWETVDLTPAPGAHDSDVGLTSYVPGWQAKAHSGYFGYAWYRIHVSVDAPPGEVLALCGPFYVDSAYQVFVNGQLLGGAGNFSGRTPVAYNMHLPRIFPLPQSFELASSENEHSALIAIRVWMGPLTLGLPDAGGIHTAPALGTMAGADSLYQRQWIELIRGYIVDAIEALLFLLLAVMACTMIPLDRSNPAYLWLTAALVLIAFARGNQAVFFWWQFETIQGFELFTIVLFIPKLGRMDASLVRLVPSARLRMDARRHRHSYAAVYRLSVLTPLLVLRCVPTLVRHRQLFLHHFGTLAIRAFDVLDHFPEHAPAGQREMVYAASNPTDISRFVCAGIIYAARPRDMVSLRHRRFAHGIRLCGLRRRSLRFVIAQALFRSEATGRHLTTRRI